VTGPARRHEGLSAGYGQLLEELTSAVAGARWRAQRVVNTELLQLYWQLGHLILTRSSTRPGGPSSPSRSSRPSSRRARPRSTSILRPGSG
jgi:hypothetical protein